MTVEEFKKLGPYVPEVPFEMVYHDGKHIGWFCVPDDIPEGVYSLRGAEGVRDVSQALPGERIVYIGHGGTVHRGKIADLKPLVQ